MATIHLEIVVGGFSYHGGNTAFTFLISGLYLGRIEIISMDILTLIVDILT